MKVENAQKQDKKKFKADDFLDAQSFFTEAGNEQIWTSKLLETPGQFNEFNLGLIKAFILIYTVHQYISFEMLLLSWTSAAVFCLKKLISIIKKIYLVGKLDKMLQNIQKNLKSLAFFLGHTLRIPVLL